MRGWSALAACTLIAGGGCESKRQAAPEPTTPTTAERPAPPIVGAWRASDPITHVSEGVLVETRESRTDYAADGRFLYVARLSVSGGKLPAKGLDFGMSAEGRWSLKDGILTERFTSALVRPDDDLGEQVDLLAEAMSEEAARRPPSQSEVIMAGADQLVLRDRETQQRVSYVRAQ